MRSMFLDPRRRPAAAALTAAGLLALSGCGGSGDDAATTPPPAQTAQATTGATTFKAVSPTSVAPNVEAGDVLLVDVREDAEWQAGHAADAIHVPLGDVGARLAEIRAAAKGRPVAFICRSGNRSAQASQIAVDAGMPGVLNVDGGMSAWAAAGLPLVPAGGTVL